MYVPAVRACAVAPTTEVTCWTFIGLRAVPSPWGFSPPPWGLYMDVDVCGNDPLNEELCTDLPCTEGVGVYGGEEAEIKEDEEGVVGESGLAVLGDRVPFSLVLGLWSVLP